jgi:hypothetical protein
MRTTIDMPDALYRKTKAAAALRGSSVKDLIIRAVETEIEAKVPESSRLRRVKLPIIRAWKGPKLDLSNFNFDELLD